MAFEAIEKLRREYTDKYVEVDDQRPELQRFRGQTGIVKTVNMNGQALVQFDAHNNEGWYDIDPEFLRVVAAPPPKKVEAKPAKPAPKAAGAPAAGKSAEPKPAAAKPAEAKPAEAKPAEAKPAEAKPAEAKPAEAKPDEAQPAVPAPTAELAGVEPAKAADAPTEVSAGSGSTGGAAGK